MTFNAKFSNVILLLLLTALALFTSCDPEIEKVDKDNFGYQYYPLTVGNEWIYEVDSFLYSNEGLLKDSSHWFVKERIKETYLSGSEDLFVLERSISTDQLNWKVSDIWTIEKTNSSIKKTEENLTFVKLVFPPTINTRWDGNIFLDNSDTILVFGEFLVPFKYWDYKIVDEIIDYEVAGVVYPKVLKIREVEDDPESSILEYKNSFVYYAENIGVVQEDRVILFDQPKESDERPWSIKADKGFILNKRLISYKIQ